MKAVMGTMNSAVLGYADGGTGADRPALAALAGFGLTAVEAGALRLGAGDVAARFGITKSADESPGRQPQSPVAAAKVGGGGCDVAQQLT